MPINYYVRKALEERTASFVTKALEESSLTTQDHEFLRKRIASDNDEIAIAIEYSLNPDTYLKVIAQWNRDRKQFFHYIKQKPASTWLLSALADMIQKHVKRLDPVNESEPKLLEHSRVFVETHCSDLLPTSKTRAKKIKDTLDEQLLIATLYVAAILQNPNNSHATNELTQLIADQKISKDSFAVKKILEVFNITQDIKQLTHLQIAALICLHSIKLGDWRCGRFLARLSLDLDRTWLNKHLTQLPNNLADVTPWQDVRDLTLKQIVIRLHHSVYLDKYPSIKPALALLWAKARYIVNLTDKFRYQDSLVELTKALEEFKQQRFSTEQSITLLEEFLKIGKKCIAQHDVKHFLFTNIMNLLNALKKPHSPVSKETADTLNELFKLANEFRVASECDQKIYALMISLIKIILATLLRQSIHPFLAQLCHYALQQQSLERPLPSQLQITESTKPSNALSSPAEEYKISDDENAAIQMLLHLQQELHRNRQEQKNRLDKTFSIARQFSKSATVLYSLRAFFNAMLKSLPDGEFKQNLINHMSQFIKNTLKNNHRFTRKKTSQANSPTVLGNILLEQAIKLRPTNRLLLCDLILLIANGAVTKEFALVRHTLPLLLPQRNYAKTWLKQHNEKQIVDFLLCFCLDQKQVLPCVVECLGELIANGYLSANSKTYQVLWKKTSFPSQTFEEWVAKHNQYEIAMMMFLFCIRQGHWRSILSFVNNIPYARDLNYVAYLIQEVDFQYPPSISQPASNFEEAILILLFNYYVSKHPNSPRELNWLNARTSFTNVLIKMGDYKKAFNYLCENISLLEKMRNTIPSFHMYALLKRNISSAKSCLSKPSRYKELFELALRLLSPVQQTQNVQVTQQSAQQAINSLLKMKPAFDGHYQDKKIYHAVLSMLCHAMNKSQQLKSTQCPITSVPTKTKRKLTKILTTKQRVPSLQELILSNPDLVRAIAQQLTTSSTQLAIQAQDEKQEEQVASAIHKDLITTALDHPDSNTILAATQVLPVLSNEHQSWIVQQRQDGNEIAAAFEIYNLLLPNTPTADNSETRVGSALSLLKQFKNSGWVYSLFIEAMIRILKQPNDPPTLREPLLNAIHQFAKTQLKQTGLSARPDPDRLRCKTLAYAISHNPGNSQLILQLAELSLDRTIPTQKISRAIKATLNCLAKKNQTVPKFDKDTLKNCFRENNPRTEVAAKLIQYALVCQDSNSEAAILFSKLIRDNKDNKDNKLDKTNALVTQTLTILFPQHKDLAKLAADATPMQVAALFLQHAICRSRGANVRAIFLFTQLIAKGELDKTHVSVKQILPVLLIDVTDVESWLEEHSQKQVVAHLLTASIRNGHWNNSVALAKYCLRSTDVDVRLLFETLKERVHFKTPCGDREWEYVDKESFALLLFFNYYLNQRVIAPRPIIHHPRFKSGQGLEPGMDDRSVKNEFILLLAQDELTNALISSDKHRARHYCFKNLKLLFGILEQLPLTDEMVRLIQKNMKQGETLLTRNTLVTSWIKYFIKLLQPVKQVNLQTKQAAAQKTMQECMKSATLFAEAPAQEQYLYNMGLKFLSLLISTSSQQRRESCLFDYIPTNNHHSLTKIVQENAQFTLSLEKAILDPNDLPSILSPPQNKRQRPEVDEEEKETTSSSSSSRPSKRRRLSDSEDEKEEKEEQQQTTEEVSMVSSSSSSSSSRSTQRVTRSSTTSAATGFFSLSRCQVLKRKRSDEERPEAEADERLVKRLKREAVPVERSTPPPRHPGNCRA